MRIRWLVVTFLLTTLVGCGGSVSLSISKSQLQSQLDEAFPIKLDEAQSPILAALSDPVVILEDGADRMGLKIHVVAKPRDGVAPPVITPPPAEPALPGPPGLLGKGLPRKGPPGLPGGPLAKRAADAGQPPKEFAGAATFSGKISYRNGAFYILDLKIEEIAIKNLPGVMDKPLRTAASKIIGKYLENNPVYQLSSDDTGSATAKMVLKSVSIQNGAIQIEVGM